MENALFIETVLGLKADDIQARKFNLWVGVSNSPWFNHADNLECLIQWARAHTRDRLLVWIPGRLYAVNIHHAEKRTRARALRDGYEIESAFRTRVTAIPHSDDTSRIRIADYDEIMTPAFVMRRAALFREFSMEGTFYARIIEIATDYLKSRGRTADKRRIEAVALYQLQELPMFIAPVRTTYGENNERYEAVVYPGLGPIDELARDLVQGTVFPELSAKLNLSEPCGIVSIARKEPR